MVLNILYMLMILKMSSLVYTSALNSGTVYPPFCYVSIWIFSGQLKLNILRFKLLSDLPNCFSIPHSWETVELMYRTRRECFASWLGMLTPASLVVDQRSPGNCSHSRVCRVSNLSERMPFLHPNSASHPQFQRHQLPPC